MKTCKCGCGAAVKPGKRYTVGHNRRTTGKQSTAAVAAQKVRAAAARIERKDRAREISKLLRAGVTYAEIGSRFGISRQRVEQIVSPLKYAARTRLTSALEKGRIERPDNCGECGTKGPVDAHHDDYTRPLDVRWLCTRCHVAADKARRRGTTIGRIPEPSEDIFSAREAAAYLGLNYLHLLRQAKKGRVRTTRGEGRQARYFRRVDLDRYRTELGSPRPQRLVCNHGHKRTPENLNRHGNCRACQANHQVTFHDRPRKAMSTYAARIVFTECGYTIDRTNAHSVAGHFASVSVSISRWGCKPWNVRVVSPNECVSYRVRTIGKLARVLKVATAGVRPLEKAA